MPPARDALWIFGYGSLLFRPDFPFEERVPARIRGFTRRLDQGSPDHRGTPERLGRVATLVRDEGAWVGGAVHRVAARDEERVLAQLDHREQGGYERVTLAALPVDGDDPRAAITATTWIATPDNPFHLGPEPLEIMVAQIRGATGPSGPNVEYVLRLADALRAMRVDDPHVEALARALAG
ncbi:MAG: gamma-glutamylcyclotransferase [Byssovorax sp.]